MLFENERLYKKSEILAIVGMSRRAFESLELRANLKRYALTQRTVRYSGRDLNKLLEAAEQERGRPSRREAC
jgi:hypothetical protein